MLNKRFFKSTITLLFLLIQSSLFASDGAFPDIRGRWIWVGGEINSNSQRTMLFEIKQITNKLYGKTILVNANKDKTDLNHKTLFAEGLELDTILQGKIYGAPYQ